MPRTLASNRFLVKDYITSLDFNGSTRIVTITSASVQNSLITQSYSCWYKDANSGGGNFGIIISKKSGTTPYFVFGFNNNVNGTFQMSANFSGGANTWRFNRGTDGVWHHIVITYDNSSPNNNPLVYIDGVSTTVTQVSGPTTGTIVVDDTNLYIGNRGDSARNWGGKIGDVHIFNRILSSTEAANLFRGYYISNGLVGYWKFDESVGTSVIDSTGNASNGIITAATYSTDRPPGTNRTLATNRRPFKKITPVLSTTGSPDKCSVTLFSSANNDITMGCWVMLKTVPGARSRIISNGRTDAFNGYALQVGAGGVVQIDISFSASVNSGFTLQPLVWYHVVCSRTSTLGSLWQIYINGNKKGGTSSNSPGTPTGSFTAAAGNTGAGNNEYLNCYMSDVRFYSRALSDTEVLQWSQGVSISSSNLLCQWLLNEGSGSSATDNSGNGNTGTITGATYSTNISDPARVLHP